jgi:hypothetical protein
MTISSISASATGALQPTGGPPPHRPGKAPSLDKTAELLGISADDLGTQLKSGKTLNEIASDRGVSSDDLLSALKSDLKSNKPAGAPELGNDLLTQIATDIAAGKRPGGPRDAGGPATRANGDVSATGTNLKTLAETLGVNETDLLAQLSSGASFTSLLGNAGGNPYISGANLVEGGIVVDEYA